MRCSRKWAPLLPKVGFVFSLLRSSPYYVGTCTYGPDGGPVGRRIFRMGHREMPIRIVIALSVVTGKYGNVERASRSVGVGASRNVSSRKAPKKSK